MILTYKVKHFQNFDDELHKAKLIAEFAVETKSRSSADVKNIGLKSVISNQILKKYSNNRKIKKVRNVNLVVPSQGIKVDRMNGVFRISSLKLSLDYMFPNDFVNINQIEIDSEYCYVSVTKTEEGQIEYNGCIGVDLNTTSHIAVTADPLTGKIKKLGRRAYHVHSKYSNMRKRFQKKKVYSKVKNAKNRESRIIKDLNHKVSRAIVNEAKKENKAIALEDLSGIRKHKINKTFKYSLNSWSFYQLKQFIEYKSKLLGIPVIFVSPEYTSKMCSRCGVIGERTGKIFKCLECGHVDHADVNAAFNISNRAWSIAHEKELCATGSLMTLKGQC